MRLLFVTQTLDADHPSLAQTLDLVNALARRCDELIVLCQSIGRHNDLAANVRVLVFGAPTRVGRARAFCSALIRELRRPPDALIAHMVPLYVVLAAPFAKLRGVRVGLWYTHWHRGRLLRLATHLSDVVFSVDVRSFPLETPKVRAIGHAIDVELFSPGPGRRSQRLRLVALGRTARWKGYQTMLDALERATVCGLDAELEIRGPQLTDDELAHAEELRRRIASSELLKDNVRVEQPVPRDQLPDILRAADALLSATQPRAGETLDKVVFEAAATGLPVVASNSALAEFLGDLPLELSFAARDRDALAERLVVLSSAGARVRREIGLELRRRVVEGHSVESWADAVTGLLGPRAPK